MWVGEILDGDNAVVQRYHFKFGKICKLGRAVENHISFPTDKSISRVHGEISTISATSLKVTDLGSSFGTLLNGEKLIPKKEYVVETNSVVQFGAMISKIRFIRQQVSFCITRLDKDEKERVKKNAKQVNATIVTIADHATHVIASSCTATVKMLTAVVLNLKIVTSNWLNTFAETDDKNPVAILPKESDFFPPIGDESNPVNVVDPSLSRALLFKKIAVLILQEEDMQYSVILNACGATVKQIDASAAALTPAAIQKHAAQLSGTAATTAAKGKKTAAKAGDEEDAITAVCIFFDESRGIPAPKHLTAAVTTGRSKAAAASSISIKWLTIHQLAVSVMSRTPPVLLDDPPAPVRTGSMSTFGEAQSQALISNDFETCSVDSNATVMEEEEQVAPQRTTGIAAIEPTFVDEDDDDDEVFEVTNKKAPPTTTAAAARKGRGAAVKAETPAAAAVLPPLPPTAAAAKTTTAGTTSAASKRRFKEVAGVNDEADEVRSVASSHDGRTVTSDEVYASPAKKPRRGANSVATPNTVVLPAAQPVMEEAVVAPSSNKRQKTAAASGASTAAATAAVAVKVEPVAPSSAVSLDTPPEQPLAGGKTDNKRKRTAGTFSTTTTTPASAAPSSSSSSCSSNSAVKAVSDSSMPQSYNADTPASFFESLAEQSAASAAHDGDGGDADWLPVLRGMERMQMLQTKRANTLIARQQQEADDVAAAASANTDGLPVRSQISDAGLSGRIKTEGSSSSSSRISAVTAKKKTSKSDLADGLSDDETASARTDAAVASRTDEYNQPVVVESKTLFNPERLRNPRVVGSSKNGCSSGSSNSSSSSGSSANGMGLKNVKRFQKNYIREVPVEDLFLSRSMDRVLPKESERELQLRLELESAMEKEQRAEQLFSDRFGAGGGGSSRARVR